MYNNIDFNFKTVLITGGAGFIGSNIAFHIQQNFPNVKLVIFDCFRNDQIFSNGNFQSLGHYQNLIGFKGDIICGNLNNSDDISKLNNYKFNFIFHLAAISDTRVTDQELVMRTNVNSFYDILELTRKNNSVLVYASSAATYGDMPSPQSIGNENPENPYGFSKLQMDVIANQFSKQHNDLTIIGLRYFNVFGKGEFYKGKTASMVIQLSHQILNGKNPKLFINSNKIFRDFIYIDDVVQSNIKACNSKKNGVFNIGTGVSRSFQDIVDIIQTELKTSLETEYFPNPHQGYQFHTEADILSSKKYFNFKPKFSLEEGIKAYMPEIIRLHNLYS